MIEQRGVVRFLWAKNMDAAKDIHKEMQPIWAAFLCRYPKAHPASCTMVTGSFPGVKSGQGVTLTPHPLLLVLVMKQ
jgi:hypothetical protein